MLVRALTGGVRALAERDEVDHAVLHLEHGGGFAIQHGDTVRAARLVWRQTAGEHHQALPATTDKEYSRSEWKGCYWTNDKIALA